MGLLKGTRIVSHPAPGSPQKDRSNFVSVHLQWSICCFPDFVGRLKSKWAASVLIHIKIVSSMTITFRQRSSKILICHAATKSRIKKEGHRKDGKLKSISHHFWNRTFLKREFISIFLIFLWSYLPLVRSPVLCKDNRDFCFPRLPHGLDYESVSLTEWKW